MKYLGNLQEKSDELIALMNSDNNRYRMKVTCKQNGTLLNYCNGECENCSHVEIYDTQKD